MNAIVATAVEAGFRLQPLERRHLDRTFVWVNDPGLCRLLGKTPGISRAEHERWFSDLARRDDCRYFAIESSDGRHVGNVWLWAIDRQHAKAELRIVLPESEAGRGVGPRLIELACAHAFAELELHRVYAYVLETNRRALRAFEKAGFVVEGRLREDRRQDGGFIDSFLLGRLA
jgi:RimJ/RimL family protein N-acetyltransferase